MLEMLYFTIPRPSTYHIFAFLRPLTTRLCYIASSLSCPVATLKTCMLVYAHMSHHESCLGCDCYHFSSSDLFKQTKTTIVHVNRNVYKIRQVIVR